MHSEVWVYIRMSRNDNTDLETINDRMYGCAP